MGRVIKFRAWDKLENYWRNDFIKLTNGVLETAHPNIEVMQFTGLLDKNGKEIFEGDILKHNLWGPTTVVWDNEGACFRGNSEERDMTLAHHQLQRSRVIGNIYEHPELLEEGGNK